MSRTRMVRGAWLAAVLLLASLAAGAGRAPLPLPAPEAAASITASDLKRHLTFLASKELGGRYTLSPSNRIAARYLASQLEYFGYRGGAHDGSFLQRVPLFERSVDLSKSVLVLNARDEKTATAAPQTFRYAEDYYVEPWTSVNLTGDLVFVGYGISSPKNNYDDYAGLDLKGKIAVAVSGTPTALTGVWVRDDERLQQAARARGAVGLIVLPSPQTLAVWDQIKQSWLRQEQITLPPHPGPGQDGEMLPMIAAGPKLLHALAPLIGESETALTAPEGKPVKPSAAIQASANVSVDIQMKDAGPAQNVVGILEGSDPTLKSEYVVFSAHYDHLKTSDNGEIYPGADDDGSGTASVLEIARAFTVGPRSKRSILIIFHTGEEIGLFGSEYNTDYDPVEPLSQLVADLNIDMVGRSRPKGDNDPRDRELADKDTLYIIGADKLSTELNQINNQTNAETAHLKFDYRYNDDKHPERFYYRSDHYNYAKHGIPVIFYFNGVHRDYHRPTDTVDKIDFERMERIDRMIFATGWRIANLDHRLAVDKKPAADAAQ